MHKTHRIEDIMLSTRTTEESGTRRRFPPFDPHDPLGIDDLLEDEERAVRDTVDRKSVV